MNWENYGIEKTGWVIDHIIPLKHFINNYDLPNDFNAQKKAFGKHNLQPLWWMENATKAAKIDINYDNLPIKGKYETQQKKSMKYIIIFFLLTNCALSDYDFNPTTTILKQLIKVKNETQ